MSILGKLGDALKQSGKNISDNIIRDQEIRATKNQILDLFMVDDLKKICYDYGIGKPSPYEVDNFTGQRRKIDLRKRDYVHYVANRLTIEQVINFCRKNRISIPSELYANATKLDAPITYEKQNEEIVSDSDEFELILDYIEHEFKPSKLNVRDERDFENVLFNILENHYPGRIESQVKTANGKIDIVIDTKYGIELKLADNVGVLRNLIGQIIFYKKDYDRVAIVLLVDNNIIPEIEIKKYLEEYNNYGVRTIIKEGSIRRQKQK
jgi:hypothetical protein